MTTKAKDALVELASDVVCAMPSRPCVLAERVADAILAHPAEVLAAMVEAGKLTQIAPRRAYIGGACDQFEAAYPCVLGARAFVHIPPVTGSARTEGQSSETEGDG